MPPLEIHVLQPSSTQCVPSRTARVVIAPTSDPASGSDSANAAIASPRATAGSQRRCCSSLPASVIAPLPRPCIANAKSARPSWNASVSRATHSARESSAGSAPPWAAGTQ